MNFKEKFKNIFKQKYKISNGKLYPVVKIETNEELYPNLETHITYFFITDDKKFKKPLSSNCKPNCYSFVDGKLFHKAWIAGANNYLFHCPLTDSVWTWQYHNDFGPARIWSNGKKEWCKEGYSMKTEWS